MSYKHAEAFCLMMYQSEDGMETEILWNSRDGVTPLVIMNRDGTKEMLHGAWEADRCVPDHVPKPGDRVFVDLSLEKARESRREYVEQYWNTAIPGAESMSAAYPGRTKEQVIEKLARRVIKDYGEHAPHIVTWTGP